MMTKFPMKIAAPQHPPVRDEIPLPLVREAAGAAVSGAVETGRDVNRWR